METNGLSGRSSLPLGNRQLTRTPRSDRRTSSTVRTHNPPSGGCDASLSRNRPASTLISSLAVRQDRPNAVKGPPTVPKTVLRPRTALSPATTRPQVHCTSTNAAKDTPSRSMYGLAFLNESQFNNKYKEKTQPYPVDIVAVHGFNGDAYDTFTAPGSGEMWVSDYLPSDLPGARIFTFGYPAQRFTLETGDMDSFATSLLNALLAKRITLQVLNVFPFPSSFPCSLISSELYSVLGIPPPYHIYRS